MLRLRTALVLEFRHSGYALLEGAFPASELPALRLEADSLLSRASDAGGVRNVLRKSPLLRDLASSGLPAILAQEILGGTPRPTKLTVFDKTPAANWKVPWHQDLTVAVAERREVEGFGPWSLKDGVPHVQPPVSVLGQVLAIRLHLDDAPLSNGALRVLPGTHRLGRLSRSQISSLRREIAEVACPIQAGGCMLMSPLLLHASRPAASPDHRRVLHFEYSSAQLPGGLSWA